LPPDPANLSADFLGGSTMEFGQYYGLTGLAFFVLFILEELLGYPFDAKR
jgi:hypothetical protein